MFALLSHEIHVEISSHLHCGSVDLPNTTALYCAVEATTAVADHFRGCNALVQPCREFDDWASKSRVTLASLDITPATLGGDLCQWIHAQLLKENSRVHLCHTCSKLVLQ